MRRIIVSNQLCIPPHCMQQSEEYISAGFDPSHAATTWTYQHLLWHPVKSESAML